MDIDGEKIVIKFVTKIPKYKVTEKPFQIPINANRPLLSKTMNFLLGKAGSEQVSFDFLIENEFLRTTLEGYLKSHNKTKEEILTIECVEALTPPEPASTNTHPDWISAIDDHLSILNAALEVSVVPYGSYDNKVWLLSRSEKGAEPTAIGEHKLPVTSLSSRLDAGGNVTLVSGSQDQTIEVWQVNVSTPDTSELIATLEGHEGSVEAVEFSPNGDLVASGSWDNTGKIWAARPLVDEDESSASKKSKPKKRKSKDSSEKASLPSEAAVNLAGHAGSVTALSWIGNEVLATGAWDHTIQIWDVGSGVSTHKLNGNKAFLSIKYSPATKLLVSGLADRTIRVWDPRLSSGEASAFENQTYTSHQGWVSSVVWHPTNNYYFLSAGYDGTVKVWDLRSITPLHTIKAENTDEKLLDIQWLNNQTFTTGGSDGKLRFFADHATAL